MMVCTVAPISLYSTTHHNTARIRSHTTYHIQQRRNSLLVNGKVYDLYSKNKSGVISYIRGGYLILRYNGNYFIRKVGTTHTGRLRCK